jgi:hypothetical protein
MVLNNASNHPGDDNDLNIARTHNLVVRLDRPFSNEVSVDVDNNGRSTVYKGEITCRLTALNNLDIIDSTIKLYSGIYGPQQYGGQAFSSSWVIQTMVSICSPYHLNERQDGFSDEIRKNYRHDLAKKAIQQGNTYPRAELFDQIFSPLEQKLAQFYIDYSNIQSIREN